MIIKMPLKHERKCKHYCKCLNFSAECTSTPVPIRNEKIGSQLPHYLISEVLKNNKFSKKDLLFSFKLRYSVS